MARRFGTSYQMNCYTTGFGTSPVNANNSVFTDSGGNGIHYPQDAGRLYIAPSAYSEVRKVVFWACIRHEHTGTDSPAAIQARVHPSSTSTSERLIESAIIADSSMNNTVGAGGLWTTGGQITDEALLYNAGTAGNKNLINTIKFGTTNTEGSQLVFQEFDRFAFNDADFFNDWDTIAAQADNNRHVAYSVDIQRTDGQVWTTPATNVNTKNPIIIACGFAIIQAPSPNNRTRIYLPASPGYDTASAINTLNGRRGEYFYYHANEWDGTVSFHTHHRQVPSGGNTGFFDAQVGALDLGATTVTERSRETYNGGLSAGNTWFGRSGDIIANLVDGDILTMQYESGTLANMGVVYSTYEITVENFNLLTAYFGSGHGPNNRLRIPGGVPAGGQKYNQGASLFDPLWFEDFEEERFLEVRQQGGMLHLGSTITDSQQQLTLNANLDEDVSASLFNTNVLPEVDTGTNTPDQHITLDAALTTEDPTNFAGKRKMTQTYKGLWTGASDDYPGSNMFVYLLQVPNTDVVDLGPLFDLGAFDSEGCASTSAGLGDPGVLIISNGSTIPKKFNPVAVGTAAEIEDAGIPEPFEGEIPSTQSDDTAQSPDGGLAPGTYKYRYTFRNCCTGKESDPSLDDIDVDTTGNSPAANVTISFAGVRIPGDAQICEICLYRTLEGGDFPIMAKVGCLDISETTVFVDTKSDAALDFTNEGLSILNAPMPCVPVVVDFRNRLFGMGDIPNLAPVGTVSVVKDSDMILGSSDVEWDRCLEGRFIKVAGDCRFYEVLRVLPPEEGLSPPIQRLKLTDLYEGETDTGLSFELCGRPNRLYFSEPLEPECWPVVNFIDVEPGDGDRLMGAASNFDSLVICKRRKSYVLRFNVNPANEVFVPSRISSDVGCIGPRTFAQVESGTCWLAERGIALFDGRSVQHIPESEAMNDIFTKPDNPNYIRRDRNGRVIDAVGVFYPATEQYLLILPTVKTTRGCSMMLVWDVKLRNITLLEFCQEFQSMVVAKDADGNERVLLGDTNGFVWTYDVGDTDGAGFPNATGTVVGDVSNAGIDEATGASILDDATASFITGGVPGLADLSGVAGLSGALDGTDMGLAGACLHFRRKTDDYEEPWKSRTIYASTATRLFVTPQWGPDVPYDPTGEFEYEYMIGAIEFDLLFKPQNFGVDDMQKRNWRQVLIHEIQDFASKLRVDLLEDFGRIDLEAGTVVDPVTDEVGQGRIFAQDYSKGRQVKPVGISVYDHMAIRMRNFAPEAPISVINHILCASPRSSK